MMPFWGSAVQSGGDGCDNWVDCRNDCRPYTNIKSSDCALLNIYELPLSVCHIKRKYDIFIETRTEEMQCAQRAKNYRKYFAENPQRQINKMKCCWVGGDFPVSPYFFFLLFCIYVNVSGNQLVANVFLENSSLDQESSPRYY